MRVQTKKNITSGSTQTPKPTPFLCVSLRYTLSQNGYGLGAGEPAAMFSQMITDGTKKQEIDDDWKGVRSFQSRIQRYLNISGGIGSVGATDQLRDISHNLVLLFAFSVLETTLKQLKEENIFAAKRNNLKTPMEASKTAIIWQNYDLIDNAREDRNRVAHDQTILTREKCWEYIDGVENELVTWKVVSRKVPFDH